MIWSINLTALGMGRTRLIVAVFFLILGISAALSLNFTERASAQDVATPEQVGQLAAPTLAPDLQSNGILLSWTLNADVPVGWKISHFSIVRGGVTGLRPVTLSDQPVGTARSYLDSLDGVTKTKYFAGSDIYHGIRPVYVRDSDGEEVIGQQGISITLGMYTPSELSEARAVTTVTATAHADGMLVKWQHTPRRPPGWKHIGFGASRWQQTDASDEVVFYDSRTDTETLSAKDPMTGVDETQRFPGVKWYYGAYAIYEPILSGSDYSQSPGRVWRVPFTLPALPGPQDVSVRDADRATRSNHRYWTIEWSAPDLSSLDSSLGFDEVDEYLVHLHDANNARVTRYKAASDRSDTYVSVNACHYGHWVRARVGLFFSADILATNNRSAPCNDPNGWGYVFLAGGL